MHVFSLFESDACQQLTVSLGHFLWQGVIIALLAGGVSALLRRDSVRVRYAIHVAALACMGVCLPVTFLFVAANASSRTTTVAMEKEESASAKTPNETEAPPVSGASVNAKPASAWSWASPYVAQAYLLGMTLMWLRFAVAVRGGQRLRRHAVEIDDEDLVATIAQAARRVGLRRVPAVAFCRLVSGPVVIGFLHPLVLVPVSVCAGLSPSQFQAIIAHEFAHIRRYDHVVLMLQRTVESLLFFHPAVWYISNQLSTERENCCDDAVLSAGGEPIAYAKTLLHIAELGALSQTPTELASGTSLAAVGRGESRLRQRIARLIGRQAEPHIRVSRVGLSLILLAMTAVIFAPPLMQTWAQARNRVRVARDGNARPRPFRRAQRRRAATPSPGANNAGEATPTNRLAISMAAEGGIQVDGKTVPPSQLIHVLREAMDRGVTEALVSEERTPEQKQIVKIAVLIKMGEALRAGMAVPKADENAREEPQAATQTITRVTITLGGNIIVDNKALALAQLRMLQLAGHKVIISADEETPHSRVVEVLDALSRAGAADTLITTVRTLNGSSNSYLRFPESVERAMMGDALRIQRGTRKDVIQTPTIRKNVDPTGPPIKP